MYCGRGASPNRTSKKGKTIAYRRAVWGRNNCQHPATLAFVCCREKSREGTCRALLPSIQGNTQQAQRNTGDVPIASFSIDADRGIPMYSGVPLRTPMPLSESRTIANEGGSGCKVGGWIRWKRAFPMKVTHEASSLQCARKSAMFERVWSV